MSEHIQESLMVTIPYITLIINTSIVTKVFGLVYKRSVDISTENFSIALEEIISSLDENIKTYIMGDFNIHLLNYITPPPVENFLNLMISRNYYPVITRPTRVTPLSCTLIDNIFSNRVDEIESSGVITTNISVHNPIFSRELRPSLADNVLSINYRVFLMKICLILEINFNTQTGNQFWTMMTPMNLMNYSKVPSYLFSIITFFFWLKTYIIKQTVNHLLPQEY